MTTAPRWLAADASDDYGPDYSPHATREEAEAEALWDAEDDGVVRPDAYRVYALVGVVRRGPDGWEVAEVGPSPEPRDERHARALIEVERRLSAAEARHERDRRDWEQREDALLARNARLQRSTIFWRHRAVGDVEDVGGQWVSDEEAAKAAAEMDRLGREVQTLRRLVRRAYVPGGAP